MVKKMTVKEKKRNDQKNKNFLLGIFNVLWFIVRIPYFIVNGIYKLVSKIDKKTEENAIEKKRESIKPAYAEFKVIETLEGKYDDWKKNAFNSDSKIGIIIGARGSGKTAFGIKFLENIYSSKKKDCYAIGFNEEDFPSWIKVVKSAEEIPNDSFVLIDEGGILFSSRSSMSSANKLLSNLILIARHKNLNILFISQNSSNLDVNILRQADYLVLKKSSLLQKEFERKIVQKTYLEVKDNFEKLKDVEGLTYIYSEDFRGFISNSLPSFWGMKISKSFR